MSYSNIVKSGSCNCAGCASASRCIASKVKQVQRVQPEVRPKLPKIQPKLKHCPVCAKAGMSEEIVSSHYVRETRDPGSRVTCPLIRKSVCGRCGKNGHFATSCKVVYREPKMLVKTKTINTGISNRFCFSDSDESDDENGVQDESDEPAEPAEPKEIKSAKDIASENMVNDWQTKYAYLLGEGIENRNTCYVHWDSKHSKFVEKGYNLIEKTVVGETFLVAKREKTSWADSDSDSD